MDRADEPWLLSRRVAITRRSDKGLTAGVSLVCIDSVVEPQLLRRDDSDVPIADAGFCWVHHVPPGARYAVTTVVDTAGEVVVRRVDICSASGVGMGGVPWFQPLPLHVLIWPGGETSVVGTDRLEDAVTAREISADDRLVALEVLESILELIDAGAFAPIELGPMHHAELLAFAV